MKDAAHTVATLVVALAAHAWAISITENYTMCSWSRLRAGVIRDAVYLDGGELWYQASYVDGSTSDPTSDGNPQGDMWVLNFSDPFTIGKTNLTRLFTTMQKAGGAANNIAPNYIDGTMFANNDELYLYGGLALDTNASTPQGASDVLGYEAYQYGPYRQSWSPGFYQGTLPNGVTRYVTNGAGVTAASENLGFYFSGMRAADWGPINYNTHFADTPANTLIEIDMSTMRAEKWTNTTLPDTIQPRANAELVWIPVSTQGMLVAIGGVYPPEEIWPYGLNNTQTSESESESPTFMTSLPVYDIASQTWYLQNTTGGPPPQLTEFCSVVAAANDSSSYSVYIYGGYDGLNAADLPSDDVWILSVPAFSWVKAYSGTQSHGRSGHRCVTPYPNQMFVIGGVHQSQATCVEGGIIQVFDMNKLDFQDSYDPTTWSSYQVPDAVTAVIGGTANGGATKTAAWSDHNLGNLFSTKYAQRIPNYYPYPANTTANGTGNGTTPIATPQNTPSHNTWLAPVLGTVLGLLALCILILIFLLLRRRKLMHRNSINGSSTSGTNTNRILRWVNGMPAAHEQKDSQSITSEEPDDATVSSPLTGELGGRQRFEMPAAEPTKKVAPPQEMATPYHFQEHPSYPRSIDYAYGPAPGQPHSPALSRSGGEGSEQSSVPSAPSPYVSPFSPDDVNQNGNSSGSNRGALSDLDSVPENSSGDNSYSQIAHQNGIPPVPTIPTNPADRWSGPTHARNSSSLSSQEQNDSSGTLVSPEEDQRRSAFFANLPNTPRNAAPARVRGMPSSAAAERDSLVSPITPVEERPGAKRKPIKQSSFQEGLDETGYIKR